jgi:glyoxylase-like metal-dependent hydrolase (beta-lactamase superfamily II)
VELDPLPPPDHDIVPGRALAVGGHQFEVRHVPGHSPGSVALVGDGVALVGDVLFAGSVGRTDLPGGNSGLLLTSIRTQLLTLPDETVVYPGHGPETTIGRERATNPFLTGTVRFV